MFRRVLIANRGEIACRILRTLRRLGVAVTAVHSEADAHAPHVALADDAVCVGPAPVRESYLRVDRILEAARATGAEAVHPGYGLLSENPEFAEACEAAGVAFVGPTPAQMRAFGLKHTARALAREHGVPLLPGTGLLADADEAVAAARDLGFPVMLKSTAGGGGIGMQRCDDADTLARAFASVERLARGNFSSGGLFLERLVERARHVEVQIFGDGRGRVAALGERDCSVQRRNQKVIEETPAPGLRPERRAALADAAVRLARAVSYRSAGTVEFVLDAARGDFFFLEVNTRLQVEHGVTEAVTGIDLVEWMLRLAAGEPVPLERAVAPRGHAIQVRLYAEDPARDFQPSCGVLTDARFPEDVRVDGWVERGTEVTPYYDPLLAKLIVHGDDRAEATARLRAALDATRLGGIVTNRDYLRQLVDDPVFRDGRQTTRWLQDVRHVPAAVEVVAPGTHTTVQDWPGRLGYWAVGVPPSGPMDALALRFANRLLGNPEGAAGLEITFTGPTLRFACHTWICLAGAPMDADLDGAPVPWWRPVAVAAGGTLRLGRLTGAGFRTYLAVRGGLDVPEYLGSRSTFTLGLFGGHAGRCLRVGDVLPLAPGAGDPPPATDALPDALVPAYGRRWEVGVCYGPQGAPDFFTPRDVETFFAADWEVHFNSSRTGVRLVGPKPEWARADGGEAGLHPSNLHDNPYAVGAVDFTGDMPIVLGPDGPSLGGFCCPATVVEAELWKVGQLAPGDRVRFVHLDRAEARRRAAALADEVSTLQPARARTPLLGTPLPPSAVVRALPEAGDRPTVAYRPCGDAALLVEYGPHVLDLTLRFRVHALMQWLERRRLRGVVDVTPGIRTLQVHVDPAVLPLDALLDVLAGAEAELPAIDAMEVPTRVVHLPLSWDDEATQLAIRKYMAGVRADAPWCPSNIEFIRRINGLDSVRAVRDIVYAASYLVLGLGDVYLGAPVATPIDPRHRLVTTKYNPARTWTPENAVGIGGAYLCIYGMEGPGGYQFVGRTVQMWNRWKQTADFRPGTPWLLRFFDQIRFFPVSGAELLRMRDDFVQGRLRLDVREETFSLRRYRAFLREHAGEIAAGKARQQAAFDAERARWAALGTTLPAPEPAGDALPTELPDGCEAAVAHVPGNVWKIAVAPGDAVRAGDPLVVLESMKMEIPIPAPVAGTVVELRCAEGGPVGAGDTVCVLRT